MLLEQLFYFLFVNVLIILFLLNFRILDWFFTFAPISLFCHSLIFKFLIFWLSSMSISTLIIRLISIIWLIIILSICLFSDIELISVILLRFWSFTFIDGLLLMMCILLVFVRLFQIFRTLLTSHCLLIIKDFLLIFWVKFLLLLINVRFWIFFICLILLV